MSLNLKKYNRLYAKPEWKKKKNFPCITKPHCFAKNDNCLKIVFIKGKKKFFSVCLQWETC